MRKLHKGMAAAVGADFSPYSTRGGGRKATGHGICCLVATGHGHARAEPASCLQPGGRSLPLPPLLRGRRLPRRRGGQFRARRGPGRRPRSVRRLPRAHRDGGGALAAALAGRLGGGRLGERRLELRADRGGVVARRPPRLRRASGPHRRPPDRLAGGGRGAGARPGGRRPGRPAARRDALPGPRLRRPAGPPLGVRQVVAQPWLSDRRGVRGPARGGALPRRQRRPPHGGRLAGAVPPGAWAGSAGAPRLRPPAVARARLPRRQLRFRALRTARRGAAGRGAPARRPPAQGAAADLRPARRPAALPARPGGAALAPAFRRGRYGPAGGRGDAVTVALTRDPLTAAAASWDLIVVGGGAHGVMLALEASRRGLATLLVERDDFGAATSSSSLRIVHGGLRYLQRLDFVRYRESMAERRWLLSHFPDLVEPLPCLMPLWSPPRGGRLRRRTAFRLAFAADELLSRERNRGVQEDRRVPPNRLLDAVETAALCPGVDRDGLRGGALWYDAVAADSPRLLIEALRWACRCGAQALNYVEACDLLLEDGRVAGLDAVDRQSGRHLELRAPTVVNCAGPWSRAVAARFDRDLPALL